MNVQPVVPVSLTKNLNLIARWVQPIMTQYNITGVAEKQSGLADGVVSAFLSPANSKNGFTWGAGPVFLVPVASSDAFKSKQFGIGPTAVALKQTNGWTLGGLVNQVWRVSGGKDRPKVNQFFLQPFVNYNWKSGAGLGANVEWTHNWTAKTDVVWLNPTISGLTALGKQKTQLAIGPRFNISAPSNAKASMGWRAVVIFLFPK